MHSISFKQCLNAKFTLFPNKSVIETTKKKKNQFNVETINIARLS